MRLELDRSLVRPWRASDAPSLALHANNRNVWINLRDAFPHPYTLADAERYLAARSTETTPTSFAIEIDGAAVGGVGFFPGTDVERVSAELGYWLAEPYWGRGVMTEVVRALTEHAVGTHGLTRVFAMPFEWNRASCRVLEKAGYVLEARLRRAVVKDARIIDQWLYAFVVPPS